MTSPTPALFFSLVAREVPRERWKERKQSRRGLSTSESIIREGCEREKEKIFTMLLARRPTRRFCRGTLLSYIDITYTYYIRKHSYTYTWKSRATFHANANVGRDRIYTTTIWHHIPTSGISRHKLPPFCPWETTYGTRLSAVVLRRLANRSETEKFERIAMKKERRIKKKGRKEWDGKISGYHPGYYEAFARLLSCYIYISMPLGIAT